MSEAVNPSRGKAQIEMAMTYLSLGLRKIPLSFSALLNKAATCSRVTSLEPARAGLLHPHLQAELPKEHSVSQKGKQQKILTGLGTLLVQILIKRDKSLHGL